MGWLAQNIILIALVLCVGMCILGMGMMGKKGDSKSDKSSQKNEKNKED